MPHPRANNLFSCCCEWTLKHKNKAVSDDHLQLWLLKSKDPLGHLGGPCACSEGVPLVLRSWCLMEDYLKNEALKIELCKKFCKLDLTELLICNYY